MKKKKLAKHTQNTADFHAGMNTFIFSQTVKKDSIHFGKQSIESWSGFLLEDCMSRKGFLILFKEEGNQKVSASLRV